MKASGIVAEYNPFHKGHAYQISKIKEESDADLIVAVMSGNFLQRGEPAIVDKWTRAEMAMNSGVDLLVELPTTYSVQPADLFAKGAIQLLSHLDIDYLSFGTEEGEAADFYQAAADLIKAEKVIAKEIKKDSKMNMSYAEKMEKIIYELKPDFPLDIAAPNTQLGISYQKELFHLGLENKIKLLPVQRIGPSYGEKEINYHPSVASATAIRQTVFSGQDASQYLTPSSAEIFKNKINEKVSWESYFSLLKYELLVKSEAELREIYQMTEGLENRLKKMIKSSSSFDEFINKIKTKRYTRTRLQRLLIYVLLNIKEKEMRKNLQLESPIRILAFNQTGRLYLNQKKNKIDLPIISNVNQKTKKMLKDTIKAGEIYALANQLIKKQDFTRKPLIID